MFVFVAESKTNSPQKTIAVVDVPEKEADSNNCDNKR